VTKELAAALQCTISHFFARQGTYDKKQHDCCPHPPHFSGSPLKIELKGHHFDTNEVNKAELQALTEHDFLDAFKKWQKHWEQSILTEGDYLEC
jgi:hypothetical protein